MTLTRRDWLRLLLAAPLAATVDVEQLLWVPKPIITVPAIPTLMFHRDAFSFVMQDIELQEFQRRYNQMISQCAETLAKEIDRDLVKRYMDSSELPTSPSIMAAKRFGPVTIRWPQ